MELFLLLQETHEPFPWGEILTGGIVCVIGGIARWLEKRKMKRNFRKNGQA